MKDKVEKWQRWINRIEGQVKILMMNRWFNAEFEQIVNRNPKLRPDMPFLDYFRRVYSDGAAMSVRRQAKPHPDSISLMGLLKELEENPTLISRSWTRELYKIPFNSGYKYNEETAHRLADLAFKKFADPGGEYLDAQAIRADIEALQRATADIVTLTDQAIAHDDKSGVRLPTLPTFDQLDTAIRELERLTRKYILLLTGMSFSDLTPVDQTNARSVFTFPWIDVDGASGTEDL